MCVDDLLAAFKKKHPQIEQIYVQTLPPGILAKQIEGGSLTFINFMISKEAKEIYRKYGFETE